MSKLNQYRIQNTDYEYSTSRGPRSPKAKYIEARLAEEVSDRTPLVTQASDVSYRTQIMQTFHSLVFYFF
jgi:hypothetical protein